MRELWIEIKKSMPSTLRKALIEAVRNRCNAVFSDEINGSSLRAYGMRVASLEGGDISIIDESKLNLAEAFPKPSCIRLVIKNRSDEDTAIKAVEKGIDYVAISCSNWKIIPLENLIAKAHGAIKLLAEVSNAEEAKVALETLELGVDGVILKTSSVGEVKSTKEALIVLDKESRGEHTIQLARAKITRCTPLSLGTKVCIDTCDIMIPGEGMLIGCNSSELFLVETEVQKNPHVESRPFRVNAGPTSLYILAPDNKTRYLSELRPGDETMIVDREGRPRRTIIGRVKIERSPLMMVEAEFNNRSVKTIIQNAETTHFVTEAGSKSVTELKKKDEVIVFASAVIL